MCDWHRYVTEHLSLPGLKGTRERDIIAEVASQLEDVYLDSLSRGRPKEAAEEAARAHIQDWDAFAAELMRAERSRRRARGDAWAEEAGERLREKGGRWAAFADPLQDIRLAFRNLRSTLGFTAVALLTLALGIGGVATIFTLYDQVLLRPLPYPDSGELVQLWEKLASFENASVSYPNFLDWRERNRVFEDVGVWNETRMALTGSGDPQQVLVGRVSASVLTLLRATPVLGRTFLPEEDRLGASPVAVLSHAFWQERFGEDSGILGQVLHLDGYPFEVVGVLPPDLRFPPGLEGVDLYAPAELFAEDWLPNRGVHPGLTGLARLLPGVSLERAREDMERVAVELEAEYFEMNEGSRVHVAPLQERVTSNAREPISLLLLAVGFLFLISCINVATLVLARATGRAREMAVRASLGADQPRILRLLLTETLVLWILGGILGLGVAIFGIRGVTTLLAEQIPPVFRVGLDLRVVTILLAISLATGLAFGLPPAVRLARSDLQGFLKEGVRTGMGLGRARFRNLLVVAEVSLAVALLVAAGLTLRSFSRIAHTHPGIDVENVLVVEINLPDSRYGEEEARSGFYRQLLDRIRSEPGVVSAATGYNVPLGPGGWQNAYHVEGEPPEEGGQYTFAEVNSVSTDYLRTMGIPLLRGRDFTRQDNADAPPVVIVGEEMANRYWPGEDPLGKRMKWGTFVSENDWMEVVGVAGEVKVNGVLEDALPQIYVPHWQDNDTGYYFLLKTRQDPLDLAEAVRKAVLALDPGQPLASVGTLEAYARETTRSAALLALLMALFSGAAVLLAGVGIYGVMARMTAERRHEIGVRVALGARGGQVMAMVFRQGLVTVALGVLLGLGLAAAVARLLSSQLYQISALDPVTFVLTPALVVLVAVTANLLPARRATKVDPVRALQTE
jgi:putative ABC transport system permease protein